MALKKARGKEGSVAAYITRNQALKKLQIKLAEFRRLCILKGIHPREPKKKVHGHNKTYYHLKDINFLMHEPLLEKAREIKVHERKIKKARSKLDEALAERLRGSRPSYTLDHLVKERYPSFVDALRDLDDALTMLHLFATLPADSRHHIPAERVHTARRLALEWQAYVTRTHALRRSFVSVKGAEVVGQKITWLVPHQLSQVIPSDVDFRVMLTFLEFYETLMGFVNFKLYHELGLAYPPLLDSKLEEAAAELYAMMRDLAQASQDRKDKAQQQQQQALAPGATTDSAAAPGGGQPAASTDADTEMQQAEAQTQAKQQELTLKESQARLASLQSRLSAMEEEQPQQQSGGAGDADMGDADAAAATAGAGEELREGAEEGEEDDDEETRQCRRLFKGLVFFLAREVPRESMLLLIRAFGGTASWEGDGAPFPETHESITHQVVDRPAQKHMFLDREYVQPQWVYDCANTRVLLPSAAYGPGLIPPPHLSPFVDNEVEGYVPEYADTIKRLKENAQAAAAGGLGGDNGAFLALPGGEEAQAELEASAERVARSEEAAAAARLAEVAAQERLYTDDLKKEVGGVPFSASLKEPSAANFDETEAGVSGAGEEAEDVEEEEDEEGGEEEETKKKATRVTRQQQQQQPKKKEKPPSVATEAADEAAMAQMMMPRKTKKLYEAMQMGKAKKRAGVELLEERKRKALASSPAAGTKKNKKAA
eukprot:jgi/Mesen1/8213/ME000442S07493